MSGFVPSTRECLQRLDRMRDTSQVIADLEALNRDMFSDSVFDGNGASELNAAIARLRDLHQLALHLVANMSGGAGVPPTPPSSTSRRAQAESAAQPKTPITHWTRTPEPVIEKAVKVEPASAPLPLDLATIYTGKEAAKVIGVSFSNLSKMRTRGDLAKPLEQRLGKQHVWLRSDVHAAKARRDANPPRPGRPAGTTSAGTR